MPAAPPVGETTVSEDWNLTVGEALVTVWKPVASPAWSPCAPSQLG